MRSLPKRGGHSNIAEAVRRLSVLFDAGSGDRSTTGDRRDVPNVVVSVINGWYVLKDALG